MSEFTAKDYDDLLAGIRRIHEVADMDRLPQIMLEVVGRLIPCEHLSYNELNPTQKRAIGFLNTPDANKALDKYRTAFERNVDQHPILSHYLKSLRRNEKQEVRTISDLVSRPAYQRTAIYGECLRHLDTEFQMVLPIDMADGKAVGIAVSRKLSDFSRRDRRMLEELVPHMTRAYHYAMQRLRLQRLFDPAREQQAMEDMQRIGLTRREAQILFWIIQGKTTPQIAVILQANPRTLDKHLQNLFAKLDVETRSGAIAVLIERMEAIQEA